MIEEKIAPQSQEVYHQLQEATGSWVETGITLRHLSTGESFTSLQYQWRVGRTTICKFVPLVCKTILKVFQREFLMYACDPEDWNIPPAVGALDGKHIAIKKPKKSGTEYFKYKGSFSLVILPLVDADYRFLWANVRATGSSSDAQIFNRSKLKKRIYQWKVRTATTRATCTWEPSLHYCLLGDDTFALMPWLFKPYSRGRLTRDERIANYRISRGRRVVKNSFGIPVK